MARYQVIEEATGRKVNVAEWDGVREWHPGDGLRAEPDDGSPIWAPPPDTLTPRQFRRALRAMGLHDTFESYKSGLAPEEQDDLEYALSVERLDPILERARRDLNMPEEVRDELFRVGASF